MTKLIGVVTVCVPWPLIMQQVSKLGRNKKYPDSRFLTNQKRPHGKLVKSSVFVRDSRIGPEKAHSIEKRMLSSQESTPTLRSRQRFDVSEPSRSLVLPAPPPKMHFKLKWHRLVRRLCNLRIRLVDQEEEGDIEAM